MVTPTPSAPTFEAYYNLAPNSSGTTRNDSKVLVYILTTGLVLTTAFTVYFAIQHFKLKRTTKRIVPEELPEN